MTPGRRMRRMSAKMRSLLTDSYYGKEPLATVVQDVVGVQEVCAKLRLHAGHDRSAGPGSVCLLCLVNWHTRVET